MPNNPPIPMNHHWKFKEFLYKSTKTKAQLGKTAGVGQSPLAPHNVLPGHIYTFVRGSGVAAPIPFQPTQNGTIPPGHPPFQEGAPRPILPGSCANGLHSVAPIWGAGRPLTGTRRPPP